MGVFSMWRKGMAVCRLAEGKRSCHILAFRLDGSREGLIGGLGRAMVNRQFVIDYIDGRMADLLLWCPGLALTPSFRAPTRVIPQNTLRIPIHYCPVLPDVPFSRFYIRGYPLTVHGHLIRHPIISLLSTCSPSFKLWRGDATFAINAEL